VDKEIVCWLKVVDSWRADICPDFTLYQKKMTVSHQQNIFTVMTEIADTPSQWLVDII
jgi:hypothetical protein